MSVCLSRLVHLTLSATDSGFHLVLYSRFPNEIIWFLWKLILDSLKGIIRCPGYLGIGSSITPSSHSIFLVFLFFHVFVCFVSNIGIIVM